MSSDKDDANKRVYIRPPSNIQDMSDEEMEQWAKDMILTPLLGPAEAEPKKSD